MIHDAQIMADLATETTAAPEAPSALANVSRRAMLGGMGAPGARPVLA